MKQLFFCALAAASFLAVTSACKKAAAEPQWVLQWEETFDNGDSFDTAVWSKIPRGTPDWSNYMSDFDSLFAIRDGKLILRGIVNYTQTDDTARFLTGGVHSLHKKQFANGRLEVRAKLNGAKGAWPAIWLMPEDRTGGWPTCGEIDIMERLNHDTIVYQTVHSHYTYDLKQTENPVSGVTCPFNPEEFNTFTVELYPDSIVYYVNDTKTNCYPRLVPEKDGQFPFDKEWYLQIDMQLGGAWVGAVDPAELPVEMEVDWVRFYQKQ